MNVLITGRITKDVDGIYCAPVIFNSKVVKCNLDSRYDPHNTEVIRPFGDPELPVEGVWSYRGTVVVVNGGNELSLDEVKLTIKHSILRHNQAFERMRREIEAFENIEKSDVARRERIPDAVRLFVWQRDQGKCVKCRIVENLEFDHIIPVVKGGSNTERNIQLLCERCNRVKGATI
jgi:hypothetical protein